MSSSVRAVKALGVNAFREFHIYQPTALFHSSGHRCLRAEFCSPSVYLNDERSRDTGHKGYDPNQDP